MENNIKNDKIIQPLLPKLKEREGNKLEGFARRGTWLPRTSLELERLSHSLKSDESEFEINSIPDMWARPLLFVMALLDPTHSLHQRIQGEWRGLLTIIALNELRKLELSVKPLEIVKGSQWQNEGSVFLQTLAKLMPTKKIADDTPWDKLYIFMYSGRPIGMTSPVTLVCTSTCYFNSIHDVSWFDGRFLIDPIPYLNFNEKKALGFWLDQLKSALINYPGINFHMPELDGLLYTIDNFLEDLGWRAGNQYTLSKIGLGMEWGIFRILDKPIHTSEEHIIQSHISVKPSVAEEVKPVLLVIDRDIAKQWMMPEEEIIVYGTIPMVRIPYNGLVGNRNRILDMQIEETVWCNSEDFFTEKLFVIDYKNALPGTVYIEGCDDIRFQDKVVTVIIPLTEILLKYLETDDIASKVRFKQLKDKIIVFLRLPLAGPDGSGKDFVISKEYSKKGNDVVILPDVPDLEIWPNFIQSGWKLYFSYFSATADEEFYAKAYTEQIMIDSREFKKKSYKVKKELCKMDQFPDAFTCKYRLRNGKNLESVQIDAGILLLRKPVPRNEQNKLFSIGVDFGIPGIHAYYWEGNKSSDPIERVDPVEFLERFQQVAAVSNVKRMELLEQFIQNERINIPFLSFFQDLIFSYNSVSRPLDEHFNDDGHGLVAELKWGDIRERNLYIAFLTKLSLQCAAEIVNKGAGKVNWIVTYPSTFSAKDSEAFMAVWEKIAKKISELTGLNLNENRTIPRGEDRDASFQDLVETKIVPLVNLDELESNARTLIGNQNYKQAREKLGEIIKWAPERKQNIQDEFGFLYNFDNSVDEDSNRWIEKKEQINYRQKIWYILSKNNNFSLKVKEHETIYPAKEEKIIEQKDKVVVLQKDELDSPEANKNDIDELKGVTGISSEKTSEHIGEELEKAAFDVFKYFFEMCEDDNTLTITNARQQARGLQFGHDLKFVCETTGKKKMRFLIECKNYSKKVTLDDIGSKLIAAEEYHNQIPIDHWILLSPKTDVTNDLEKYLEFWDEVGKYPFNVQAWTPATRVQDFFGLVPEIFDIFYKKTEYKVHPKDWSEEKRQEVIEFWKQKLEPPLRLPQGWGEYLRNPGNLKLEPKESEFERRYISNDYVKMNCKDETGVKLPLNLEEKIIEWLEEPMDESPTLLLLGEFGDGKTFFTYVLTRKLVDKFLKFPKEAWIPVRFALKNFESERFKTIQEFLQNRLNNFRADIAGWNELRSRGYKILAILDGFDEISKELDPGTIQKNIKILINCYESDYFSDIKLLITSRKHFFENHTEKDWLIDKLDNPQLLQMAPIDRKATENYLKTYAAEIGEKEKFNKLKECHDPIGLASKPLFLEMVRVSLKALPEENINEYTLYETYIKEVLQRKAKYHRDKKEKTKKADIIENLLTVLELVAQNLHQSNCEFVYLSDIRGKEDLKEWLWDLSDLDKTAADDEIARTATRSLLKRVEVKKQTKNKKWPVDFCHRSMREYFVARAVCKMIEKNLEEAERFLTGCFLSHEILFFSSEIMKKRTAKKGAFDYEPNLLKLIEKTRGVENRNRIKLGYLGGNAVNLLYQYKEGKLPKFDWRNLVLDGAILPNADLSGKNFYKTSLQFANLDNVNFVDSNFSCCNLTEVRLEETTPVQAIAITPDERILALYTDGVIREWYYHRVQRATSTNLIGKIKEKSTEVKLFVQPEDDLIILQERHLLFYDRYGEDIKRRTAFEIKSDLKLIKASENYLLLKEESVKQKRLYLVNLNTLTIVKSAVSPPFIHCDHLATHAFVIFNENEELHVIDITGKGRKPLVVPTGEKVSCLTTCKLIELDGQFLVGVGLYNGNVQIWQIQVHDWKKPNKLFECSSHKQPVKDISFIDECRIVSGALDKTIKQATFSLNGHMVGEPKEFKMTLQCRGMKIDGIIREKIEGRKLQLLIDNATQKQ